MLHFPRFLLECRLVLLGNDNTSGKQMSSEFGGLKSNSFQASYTAPLERKIGNVAHTIEIPLRWSVIRVICVIRDNPRFRQFIA